MAKISFDVRHRFDQPAKVVWDELVDWERHADWIPATKMEVEPGDPTEVGREFTARSGFGPVALVDTMRVRSCTWDEMAESGDCEVEKIGPVLFGRAGFTVTPDGTGSVVDWVEEIEMRRLPQFLAPIAAWLGAMGFKQGMKGLAKQLTRR
jgi:carbon monoxide dehydrogenase subunit G